MTFQSIEMECILDGLIRIKGQSLFKTELLDVLAEKQSCICIKHINATIIQAYISLTFGVLPDVPAAELSIP